MRLAFNFFNWNSLWAGLYLLFLLRYRLWLYDFGRRVNFKQFYFRIFLILNGKNLLRPRFRFTFPIHYNFWSVSLFLLFRSVRLFTFFNVRLSLLLIFPLFYLFLFLVLFYFNCLIFVRHSFLFNFTPIINFFLFFSLIWFLGNILCFFFMSFKQFYFRIFLILNGKNLLRLSFRFTSIIHYDFWFMSLLLLFRSVRLFPLFNVWLSLLLMLPLFYLCIFPILFKFTWNCLFFRFFRDPIVDFFLFFALIWFLGYNLIFWMWLGTLRCVWVRK